MIRQATPDDFPRILKIYAFARKFMAETGNPTQWGTHFPPQDLLLEDIEIGRLFVYENEGAIHGVFAFIIGNDPTYELIEQGVWLSDSLYGTLHRVASDGSEHGFLGKCLEFCEQQISHIRIDTHEDNVVMQKAISKNGFQYCGIIYADDGTPRLAFEKF